jgi:hypothetical protein
MASEAVQALERGIHQIIEPELVRRGFKHERSTRAFRRQSGECTQIVEFQIGARSMAGKFTVNLAVFHPDYCDAAVRELGTDRPREFHCLMKFRIRLSLLRDTLFARVFRVQCRDTGSFPKRWLTTPTDKWWPFSPDEAQVATALRSVGELLLVRGLDWLDEKSDAALLKVAYDNRSTHARPSA